MSEEEVEDAYFTFGQMHEHLPKDHPLDQTLDGNTVLRIITSPGGATPRAIMTDLFEAEWSMQYDNKEEIDLDLYDEVVTLDTKDA